MTKGPRDYRSEIEYLRQQYGSYRALARSLGVSDRTVRRIARGEVSGHNQAEQIMRRVRYYQRERPQRVSVPTPRPVAETVSRLVTEYGSKANLARSLGVSPRTIDRALQANRASSELWRKLSRRMRWYRWQRGMRHMPGLGAEVEDEHLGAWMMDWSDAEPGVSYVAYAKYRVVITAIRGPRGIESISARTAKQLLQGREKKRKGKKRRKDEGEVVEVEHVQTYRTEILGIYTKEEFAHQWRSLTQERLEFIRSEPSVVYVELVSVFCGRKPAE